MQTKSILIPWKERFEADKWGTLYAMGFEEKPKSPYKVEIRISPLTEARCQRAIEKCSRKIENLEQLVNGNFPEELKETFLGEQDFSRNQRKSVSTAAARIGRFSVNMLQQFYMESEPGWMRTLCYSLNCGGLFQNADN